MIKEMVCINCPRGCSLKVDTEKLTVEGNFCLRGKEYGIDEVTCPKRTITSTVKVRGGFIDRCSCKTEKPVEKKLMFAIMDEINRVEVIAPVHMHQVLIKDVLNTGVDVISTKEIKASHE